MVIVALPLVLLLSALRTLREFEEQRKVYLRNRVAQVAGRLETLAPTSDASAVFELLSEQEPYLLDLQLIAPGTPAGDRPLLAPLWSGQELFRTQILERGGQQIYRAYIPFHSTAGLRIARIDLDAAAADFLRLHARHNVIVALVGGFVVVLLALYAIWTARRAARLEVRQLEMEHLAHMGKMAAVLAHEIRNPLGTIKGFAQLAGERADPALQSLLEPILSETGRLENLVNDLLLYGRPPSPSLRVAPWPETAAKLESHARQLIGKRAIGFTVEAPDIAWLTDPQLLQQALLNLVRNAVEAVGEEPGGQVRLKLEAGGMSGVVISVVDNGPGMPDEARARLYEPFFTTKAFGTGLGLSITRKLIQTLGGELDLRPAQPRGTEAILRFAGSKVEKAESD